MMTKKEQLANVVAELDERETELVLRYIYQLRNDDLINEDGEVIVDSFYKNLLEDIDPNEAAVAYTEEEIKKLMGIVE
ncbi:hypothetical protein [Enterococcus cecorum]|uniref:hypothetical protein n=1 Tax=Enterococcus cecorum TaxID=44008 RepID=UPI000AC584DC|nr:hypothetical protein [Enterococcus cecorum]CAI3378012.1 hypothetical protein CIRMBP1309_00695 [Enterococcus cecorum]CAI3397173.1 hypothetical protein CIRMBP1308_00834 [Enterococcus cecorum]CAI3481364.1 hypothetical protein CIRMBP1307_01675 [Enterococcus cecorum]